VVPRASDGVSVDDALAERSAIVGALRFYGEEFVADRR
jgi:hypothetical protein